jgi:Acetyltransferase (GNAT) domain
MTEFHVLNLRNDQDVQSLLSLWGRWRPREVWAHPALTVAFTGADDQPLCLTMTSDAGAVLFPLILRNLRSFPWCPNDAVHDATGPYGYGGPFISGEGAKLADDFATHVDVWAAEHRVVSLFARLHLFDEQLLSLRGAEIVGRGMNIVRSLDLADDELWSDYEHKVRKNVKRARQQGITVTVEQDLTSLNLFWEIYQATMSRRMAEDSYRHSVEFFVNLLTPLSGHYAFFFAWLDGLLVSTELVLLSDLWSYSFLGGTDAAAYSTRPNDLLKHEIILWSRGRGLKGYVLGGGLEHADGILRYKRSFAPDGQRPFFTMSRTFDPDQYHKMVDARASWEHTQGVEWLPDPGWFPLYRAPSAAR